MFLIVVLSLFLSGCGGGDGDGDGGVASGGWVGTRQWGTDENERVAGVATAPDGSIYVTGYTRGNLDGNINAGFEDVFLTKFDTSGNRQWTKMLATPLSDYGYGVAVDSSGHIYVTGSTAGDLEGNINPTPGDGTSFFLAKFDASGDVEWTVLLGASIFCEGRSVVVGSGGDIHVIGTSTGDLDGNPSLGTDDAFIVTYDVSGNKLWSRLLTSDGNDWGRGIAADPAGNIYVTGATMGSLDGNINSGGIDIFLAKFDASGNKLWTRLLGTSGEDYARSVAVDRDGGIYITGNTDGDLGGENIIRRQDAFIVKYDSSGSIQWTRLLGAFYDDKGYSIAAGQEGNIYVTGMTTVWPSEPHMHGDTGACHGAGEDIFLIKFDASGNRLWTAVWGRLSSDEGLCVAMDESGDIYVAGETTGGLDWNTNAGGTDAFLAKFDTSGTRLGSVQEDCPYGQP